MSNLSHARGRLAASLMLTAWLTACGGGGSEPAPPPAAVIPDNVTIGATAVTEVAGANAFTNSAASLSGLTFAWNFGDGTTSAEASPKHAYASAGDFDVTLKVTNSAGTSKDVKFKIAVNNRDIVSGLSCAGDTQSGWCWQAPRPSGNGVVDTYFLSTQVGWTIGSAGEIHKTTDGGKTWIKQASGVSGTLTRVRFFDANNGWVVGSYGAVLHTTDGGVHWSLQSSGLTDSATYAELTVASPTTVVIQSSSNLFRATTDGGATWTQSSPNAGTTQVTPDGTLWAINYDGLLKSTDGGKGWTTVKTYTTNYGGPSMVTRGPLMWLMFRNMVYDPVQGYRVTSSFQRSADAGATWEEFAPTGLPDGGIDGNTLDFVDANVGAVSTGSDLYRTADGGRSWTKVAGPVTSNSFYTGYVRVTPGVVSRSYYDGGYNRIYQLSEDAGATWRKITSPMSDAYGWPSHQVQRIDAQTWVSTAYNGLQISTDGMQTWSLLRSYGVPSGPTRDFSGLWFFDAKRGLALTSQGELVETLNGGRDWAVKLTGLPQGQLSNGRIQFVDSKQGWLLASDGKVYQSLDAGETWRAPVASLNTAILRYQFIDANNGFALGLGSGFQRVLLGTKDGGQTWTQLSELPDAAAVLHFTDALHGVVAGASGRILSTDDGGKTWVNRYSGTWSSLSSITSSEAGVFWVVGSDGTILNSKDNGASWTSTGPLTTAALTKIRFLDARQGWAVGGYGTILSTQDGGKTWVRQPTGTERQLNDVFFADSRSGWVAGEYGTLMATGTGGQ